MNTNLLYMEDMARLTCEAKILSITEENGKSVIVLDQTVFYPQGGGQPYDQGTINSQDSIFAVEEVRFVDGMIKHIGSITNGNFMVGETVNCHVDASRRQLNSRLHSGGHLLDMAVSELGLDWIPGKGFHFPDGPYVEYQGQLPEDTENLKKQLEKVANNFIDQSVQTHIQFMPKEQMSTICKHVPDYLPEGKPARVVFYGAYAVPCGGTHVANLTEISHFSIRKIKLEKGNIRISYTITEGQK